MSEMLPPGVTRDGRYTVASADVQAARCRIGDYAGNSLKFVQNGPDTLLKIPV
jgi:hypothetical protein